MDRETSRLCVLPVGAFIVKEILIFGLLKPFLFCSHFVHSFRRRAPKAAVLYHQMEEHLHLCSPGDKSPGHPTPASSSTAIPQSGPEATCRHKGHCWGHCPYALYIVRSDSCVKPQHPLWCSLKALCCRLLARVASHRASPNRRGRPRSFHPQYPH